MILEGSPVQSISFRGYDFFIKRDDFLSRDFSGNKARKFIYFFDHPSSRIKKIISYGSNQSNAMYSLSVLAKHLGLKFSYVCNHIPEYLRQNPIGNYANALKNGMDIITNPLPYEHSINLCDAHTLYVNEGGAMWTSEYGIKALAKEIDEWAGDKKIDVFLPSGTGTTAVYLQKNTRHKVYTCPCVGDSNYLRKQFYLLVKDKKHHPTILEPPRRYHFGKPRLELWEMWKELKEDTGITFDLLYDPVGWVSLMQHIKRFKNPILYVHQGGLLGNVSLLERYKYKFEKVRNDSTEIARVGS